MVNTVKARAALDSLIANGGATRAIIIREACRLFSSAPRLHPPSWWTDAKMPYGPVQAWVLRSKKENGTTLATVDLDSPDALDTLELIYLDEFA